METISAAAWKDFWMCFHGSRLNYLLVAALVGLVLLLMWGVFATALTNPIIAVILVVTIIILVPVSVFLIDSAMYEHH